MSSQSGSVTEKIPETTKRVTRSSKRTEQVVEKKEKVPKKKAKKTTSKTSQKKKRKPATESPDIEAAEKPRGRGRPKKPTAKPKGRSQPLKAESLHPDTIPKTQGRGRGRGRANRGRGGVIKPAPKRRGPKYFWGRAPPTVEQLAELGRQDGCSYVLAKPYRANRGYRAHFEAELAVANLYDSD